MTVSELIEKLGEFPPDARVCVSLGQDECADMCGIGTDGAADDVYFETFGSRSDVSISGNVSE